MKALNFALKHPITVMVAMVAITLGSVFAVTRMRTDVFPDLNMPVIYVAQAYGGMDSAQMEGLITNYYEYAFLYMNGIDHVETKNIQNLALVKLYFHPGTDMAQAMAEAAIYANRAKAYFPPGTVTPVHHAPGCQQRAGLLPGAVQRNPQHQRTVRPDAVPRAADSGQHSRGSAPQPFGGSLRTIVVYLDPERLRTYNVSPQDGGRRAEQGQHDHALGQRPHQGQDADRVGQLDGDRSRRTWAISPSSRNRASTSRDLGRVEDAAGHPDRLGPGQRPALDLHADREDGRRLDAGGGQRPEGRTWSGCGRCCRRTSS